MHDSNQVVTAAAESSPNGESTLGRFHRPCQLLTLVEFIRLLVNNVLQRNDKYTNKDGECLILDTKSTVREAGISVFHIGV